MAISSGKFVLSSSPLDLFYLFWKRNFVNVYGPDGLSVIDTAVFKEVKEMQSSNALTPTRSNHSVASSFLYSPPDS